MKYLIMECHPNYVVALDEVGRFIKAKNQDYQIGQTVTEITELKQARIFAFPSKKLLGGLTAAAAVLILAFLAVFINATKTPAVFASVFLTINPEVRIDVDQNSTVVNLIGLNEDGKTLVSAYQYKNKAMEPVVDDLVDRAIELGFLYDGGKITLSLDAQDEAWKTGTSSHLKQHLSQHLENKLSVAIQVSQVIDSHQSVIVTIPPSESQASVTTTTAKPSSDDASNTTQSTTATSSTAHQTYYYVDDDDDDDDDD